MATQPILYRRILLRGILAVFGAVLGNWVLLVVSTQSGLVTPFGALTAPPVTAVTILAVIAATVVYTLCTRIWPRPDRLFIRVALIALLLSFAPNGIVLVWDETATLGAVLVLMSMHVLTAIWCVWMLTDRYSPISR